MNTTPSPLRLPLIRSIVFFVALALVVPRGDAWVRFIVNPSKWAQKMLTIMNEAREYYQDALYHRMASRLRNRLTQQHHNTLEANAANLITRWSQVKVDLWNRQLSDATASIAGLCAVIDTMNAMSAINCDVNWRTEDLSRAFQTKETPATRMSRYRHGDPDLRRRPTDNTETIAASEQWLTLRETEFMVGATILDTTKQQRPEPQTQVEYAKGVRLKELQVFGNTLGSAYLATKTPYFAGQSEKSQIDAFRDLHSVSTDPEKGIAKATRKGEMLGHWALQTSVANLQSLREYQAELQLLAVDTQRAKLRMLKLAR